MSNIFKNNEAIVHQSNKGETTVFPKNSIWYKIGFDSNMVEFCSRYNDEVIFYENDVTELAINGELPENFVTEFNQIAYGGGKPEITDYDLLAVYNVTSTTSPTSLSYSTNLTKNLAAMYIDDEQVEIGNAATFNEVGTYTVKYKLINNTSIGSNAFYNCSGLTEIVIPNSVTSISDFAFDNCVNLTLVTIGSGVTSIGNYAFSKCKFLTEIIIPNLVTDIGKYAFRDCVNLTSINIPDSVTSIGSRAFDRCSGLTSVTIGSGVTSIGDYAFSECKGLREIYAYATIAPSINKSFHLIRTNGRLYYPCGSDYSSWMLYGDSGSGTLGNVFWTSICYDEVNTPTNISIKATYNVTDISQPTKLFRKQITKSSFTAIYVDGIESMFEIFDVSDTDYYNLDYYVYKFNTIGEHTVEIRFNGVKTIVEELFCGLPDLENVVIYDNITKIDVEAFSGSTNLTSVTIPNSVTSIGVNAFNKCTSLTEIIIPDSVNSIGNQAFSNCSGLTSVTLGSGVTSIGNSAFNSCSGLTEIVIPNSVTSITSNTFYNCTSLTSITIGNSVTSIGMNAFYNCSSLTSITIPDSVTSIGESAFKYCSSLTSFTSYSYTTFNSSMFASSLGKNGIYKYPCGVNVSSVKSSNLLSTWTFECFEPDGIYTYDIATFVQTNSDERNEKLFDTTYNYFQNSIDKMYVDGEEITPTNEYVFAKAGTHVIKYTIKPNEGDYPYSISSYAFKNVIGLTSVIINDRITAIDNYAFFDCTSLTSINIPDSVKYVGTNAFSHTSLLEFTFNNDVIYGSAVLSGCSKLTNVVYNTTQVGANDCAYCYALTSVTLNDVTVIGNNAFKSCTGLTSIVLPETINEINANAFYSCSNLTDIRCFSKSISCISTAFSTISPTGTFTYYCDAAIDDVIASLPESYTKVCVKEFFSDYDAVATFNVTDVSQPVKIYDGTTNLTSVAIGDNEIGKVSTYNFSKTGEYTIKYKLTAAAAKQPSFKGCAMMTSVELLEGCTTIKYGALQDCNNLSALTLPSTLTEIAGFAFNSKNNMRIIRCYATTAPTVQNYSFYQVAKNGMLYYPCGSDYSSWLASGSHYLGYLNWSSDCFIPEGSSFYDISTIINVTSTTEPTQISAGEITTQWFTSTPFVYFVDKMYVDGVETTPGTYHTFETTGPHVVGYTLLNKSEVPMAAFSGMTNLQHVELADRIQFIAPNAFEATSNLSFINIPDSVIEISNGAFYGSGIQYAFIGSGCTTMTWNAMQNCQNLEVIFFKGTQVPAYQGDTFIENPNLAVIGYICGNSPESFTALATTIGVESVECITEAELEEFIDSL